MIIRFNIKLPSEKEISEIIGKLEEGQTLEDIEKDEKRREFIRKIFFNMIIDVALDIDGKDPRAVRFAVTPVSYKDSKDVKTIDLPGTEIQAFSGFASITARKYAFEYGKYCALEALARTDFREYYKKLELLPGQSDSLNSLNIKPFVPENIVKRRH